ncbi:MAG: bifunctional diaminohydroxyphosphoribosylaminopyrimidine deaminase/5-amino-6-(5-phosphoribosylamino)uracil reductase RibD [Barnesiella sp.]|nr:bifunctional diaminohydroxyphosphoribosylaminopyrimidine deaminase/5-amino-6-(5-phosphoribosylamino)uracil reductase RibD [Barnesiella sp.]
MATGKMLSDADYMRRALQLASNGIFDAHPNPMVGAVIVAPDGRIIGEGWHRRCGEGHAEVNAVAMVRDEAEFLTATMYVTLEPCSHYGRTPPCAELIISKRIPRVVVGCLDPFEKVSGRGVKMLRDAGVNVTVGVLEEECRQLNVRFMTAHTRRSPYVILKWAESADGYIDGRISTPLTSVMVHRLRAEADGILVGSGTALADDPRLDVRLAGGKDPVRVVLDRRGRLDGSAAVFRDDNVILVTDVERDFLPAERQITGCRSLGEVLSELYRRNIVTLLVEGGAEVHRSFIEEKLWDEVRVEQGAADIAGKVKAPEFKM